MRYSALSSENSLIKFTESREECAMGWLKDAERPLYQGVS